MLLSDVMVDTCDVSELVLVSDVEFVRLCDEVASAIDKYAATIETRVCVMFVYSVYTCTVSRR